MTVQPDDVAMLGRAKHLAPFVCTSGKFGIKAWRLNHITPPEAGRPYLGRFSPRADGLLDISLCDDSMWARRPYIFRPQTACSQQMLSCWPDPMIPLNLWLTLLLCRVCRLLLLCKACTLVPQADMRVVWSQQHVTTSGIPNWLSLRNSEELAGQSDCQ